MDEMFSVAVPPTAIFAQSDRAALIAIQWLRERWIEVPQDVSVIGFDGIDEAATSVPPLTTIAQPMAELGRRSVAAILEAKGKPVRQALPVELVVRASTAAPRR